MADPNRGTVLMSYDVGFLYSAQCKLRYANGAMQRNDEMKSCKTRAKQTGFTCSLLYTVSSRRMEE